MIEFYQFTCTENAKIARKTVHLAGGRVYKKKIAFPEFVDFYLSFGGSLRADNRWVQMARIIPW